MRARARLALELGLWALIGLEACEDTPWVGPPPGWRQAQLTLAPPSLGPGLSPAPSAMPSAAASEAPPAAVASPAPLARPAPPSPTPKALPPSPTPAPTPSPKPSGAPASTNPSLSPSPRGPSPSPQAEAGASWVALGPGIPVAGPWAVIHGTATEQDNLALLASRHRLLVIDADPSLGAFSPSQIATLQAGGQNRVLSYLNVGAIETGRSYWATAPEGLVPAQHLRQLGAYAGYPNERWMDFSDEGWQRLVLEHLAPRLLAQGVDGLFLDNLELLEHPAVGVNGPCGVACKEGGRRLIARLRAAFPDRILVNQGAIAQETREAEVDGLPLAARFDGVVREAVFTQGSNASAATATTYRLETSEEALTQLKAWKALPLKPGGHPFWVGTLDYANQCSSLALALQAATKARAAGFAPSIGDRSAGLVRPCAWPAAVGAPP